jgi:hypothetical protein
MLHESSIVIICAGSCWLFFLLGCSFTSGESPPTTVTGMLCWRFDDALAMLQ